MGPGAGFRVALETEGVPVGAMDSLQAAVEQGFVGHPQVVRHVGLVHRETVVLAGDQHRAVVQVLYRVVGAVVAELHFHGAGATGQSQQLVSQADAEHRDIGFQYLPDSLDGVIAGLRVAGAIGQEDAVGIQRQHLCGRGLGGYHGEPATPVNQHPQDIALHAVIVGHHVVGQLRRVAVNMTHPVFPAALGPVEGFLHRDFLRQVHPLETGKGPGLVQRGGLVDSLSRHQAAILGALVPQDPGQATGIDVGDGDDVVAPEVIRQALFVAIIAGQQRQVADHQAGGPDGGGLLVLGIGAGIADMRVGQGDNLSRVGGIGENFLVAAHGGIENDFTNRGALGTYRQTFENTAVFKG